MTTDTLLQMPDFAAALNALGVQTRRLDLPGGGHAQMILRKLPLLGQVGLVSRSVADPGALRAAARQSGVRILLLNPLEPQATACRAAGFFPMLTPAKRAALDLTQSPKSRLAALHQKWRNRLRRAQQSPLTIHHHTLPSLKAEWLFAADAHQARARGYRPLPPDVLRAYGAQSKNGVHLFMACENAVPVAAMLFARHGNAASYQTGHTTTRGKTFSAHNLLLWHAANWLSENGAAELDLGLIDTENAPGLARFKLGAGAQATALGGSWMYAPGLSTLARTLPRSLLI